MYNPYHQTKAYYDQLQGRHQIQPSHGQLKPHGQPLSPFGPPKPNEQPIHSHPNPPYGQLSPSYGYSQRPSVAIQPPTPFDTSANATSDFAKVWAACIDSYSSAQAQRMQQQMAQHPLYRPTTAIQQDPTPQPSAEIQAKVSRWSQAIPHPPLPVPQQCLRAYELPPRFHAAQESPVPHQESILRSAPRPVPESNPLHRNELLESPVALLQAPPKRGRNWPMPSTRPPMRSAQVLSQVASPPDPSLVAGPVVNTMKRGYDDSPVVHTSPEDEMDTPPDDPMTSLHKQQFKQVPTSNDWIEDPHICGNVQSKPCQTPTHNATHDRIVKTPFNNAHMSTAANALAKMYQGSSTDYSQPSQAMLAITLINAIPFDDDPIYMLSSLSDSHPTRVIDNLIMRFATGIHKSAVAHLADGQPIPTGSHQMLWELHFVCLQRWGQDSLLAEHIAALANSLGETP